MGAGGLVVPDVRRLCLWQGSGESDVNGTDAREEVLRDAPLHAAVLGLPRPLPWALEEAPGRRYKPRFSEQVDRENPQHCEREQRKASGAYEKVREHYMGGTQWLAPKEPQEMCSLRKKASLYEGILYGVIGLLVVLGIAWGISTAKKSKNETGCNYDIEESN